MFGQSNRHGFDGRLRRSALADLAGYPSVARRLQSVGWHVPFERRLLQVFGVNDHDSARFVSDLLGQTTVAFEIMGRALDSENTGISYGEQRVGRALMTPDDVRNLPVPVGLLFLAGAEAYRRS